MMAEETLYVPAGKYTIAGVVVLEGQLPGAHLPPSLMAKLMALVSSVIPSPFALYGASLTLRKTEYPDDAKGATPLWLISSSQYEQGPAVIEWFEIGIWSKMTCSRIDWLPGRSNCNSCATAHWKQTRRTTKCRRTDRNRNSMIPTQVHQIQYFQIFQSR